MTTESKTPVTPSGSGQFLKDQTADNMRQQVDTMRECPKCAGSGELRTAAETATQYRVSIETCTFCEGLGCVPKHKVA